MSREPVVLALPPFFGFTRRMVIVLGTIFLLIWLLDLTVTGLAALLIDKSCLHPGEALHAPWQFFTYPFISFSLLSVILALLSVWFFGSELEQERGETWLREYVVASSVGGAVLAVLLSLTVLRHVPELGPDGRMSGLWPLVMAMVLAYARFFPERELRVYFVIPVKAKYLAAIYLVVYLANTITSGHRLDAMVTLCASFAGFLYLRFAPRRGLNFSLSEQWYGMRNRYTQQKRKRAAKKFKVYMRKQGKEVNLDPSGRYIPLEDEKRDPNDKGWMN